MSRLAADGWLERNKVGRNSFYRLNEKGRQTFDTATRHIYDPPPSDWTGRFELLLIGNGEDRDASRDALKVRQPVAGRMGRALGRAHSRRGRSRHPPGSLCRG
jgi:DNA-binding transcriptional regulator PaaX